MTRVALLEDDVFLRELLVEILSERGYEVSEFGDVASARTGLACGLPDLLITDVGLPDGNGLDLVAELRETQAGAGLPVLVLSGHGAEGDFMAGFAAGASDYITKPVSQSELVAKCAMMLARARQAPRSDSGARRLPGGDQRAFGRYQIQRKLGQGSSSVVYLATDTQQQRDVALKVLNPLSASQDVCRQRFLRESYTLSSLRSPHVVSVLDFGVGEGLPYFAMELVPGPTLAERVARDGPADEGQVVSLLTGLAEALRTLDSAGLVHRDLKPDNIVLRDGRFDAPVLLDFGLAKRTCDSLLTRQGEFLGTPAYMAPETVLGGVVGHQSDLFSLGLVGCFASQGREPFPARSGLEVMRAIASQPVPLPPCSPHLRRILHGLTRIQLTERTPRAQDVLRELQALSTSLALCAAG